VVTTSAADAPVVDPTITPVADPVITGTPSPVTNATTGTATTPGTDTTAPVVDTPAPVVTDTPEVQAQDKADEQAEVDANRAADKPLTVDDVKSAVTNYVTKFGMPATQEDGPKIFIAALGNPPAGEAYWKMSLLSELPQDQLKKAVDAWATAAAADGRYAA
jgi:hypothetical protein